jgi:serine/threonine-protein kinase
VAEEAAQVVSGVSEGAIIAGKYRIERLLGAGGMGVVVAAEHIQLQEKVALKFLLPQAVSNPDAVARFLREARAAVKIKSEHVARVSDVAMLENGVPYMVMEHLDGIDLSGWLKQRGPLPVELAVEFVLQTCVAVADAHALGIVHRDLKPSNLFCVRRSDGQLSIKVLDFGISKLTDLTGRGPAAAITATSALIGSPFYMSPEQMRSSRDVDLRTDIWALGVILCELVTGRPAFTGDTVTELAIKVANDPPPSLRTLRPDASEGLEAVVFKCLEKDRSQRYRNVAELALALLPFAPPRAKASVERILGIVHAGGLSESTLDIPASPPADATQKSGGTSPALGRTTIGAKTRKPIAFAAIVLTVLAVGGAATFLVASRRAPKVSGEPHAPAGVSDARPAAVLPPAAALSAVGPAETALPVEGRLAPEPLVNLAPPQLVVPPAPGSTPAAVSASKAPGAAKPNALTRAAPLPPSVAALTPAGSPATTHAPTSPQTSRAPAKAAANCDPPYYFDARGNRVFRPECL